MTQTLTVAEKLRALSPTLARAEQRVARALFASGMIAGLETVAGLAERAGVSGPTVLRLTAKLGFGKYEDFQRDLRAELEQRGQSPLSLYPASKPMAGGTLGRCADVFRDALADTFSRISTGDFAKAIALICDVKRPIFLAGGRVSQLAAQMLYLHLYQLRANVRMIQTGLQSRHDQLLDVDQKSVLLIFDFRRYENDSVSFARSAKESGAQIVLFTDPWQSPISEFADVSLSAQVTSPSAYDSLVPTFALIEAVYTEVLDRLGADAIGRIERIESLRTGFEWQDESKRSSPTGLP